MLNCYISVLSVYVFIFNTIPGFLFFSEFWGLSRAKSSFHIDPRGPSGSSLRQIAISRIDAMYFLWNAVFYRVSAVWIMSSASALSGSVVQSDE